MSMWISHRPELEACLCNSCECLWSAPSSFVVDIDVLQACRVLPLPLLSLVCVLFLRGGEVAALRASRSRPLLLPLLSMVCAMLPRSGCATSLQTASAASPVAAHPPCLWEATARRACRPLPLPLLSVTVSLVCALFSVK